MSWLAFAIVSAVAAALTAVFAKVGVEGVPSTLAMAIRTVVVVVLAWMIVMTLGEERAIPGLSRRTWIYLGASGLATGVSWWAYFRAIQLAPASWVAPIDKLSLPLTVFLAAVFLREAVSWQAYAGVALMVIGALLTRA
jgi:transporter family protein